MHDLGAGDPLCTDVRAVHNIIGSVLWRHHSYIHDAYCVVHACCSCALVQRWLLLLLCQGEECPEGPNCPHSHNAFESWLHPQKYRTLLCKDQQGCKRAVCFFAHGREQLRVPSDPVPQMHTTGDGALPAACAGLLRSTSNSSSNVSSPARHHYSSSSFTLQSGSPGSTPISGSSNSYLLPILGPGLTTMQHNSSPPTAHNTEQLLARLLAQVQLAWQESTPGSQTAAHPTEQQLHMAAAMSASQVPGHTAASGSFSTADNSLQAQLLFRPAVSISHPMAQENSSSMMVQPRLHPSPAATANTAAAEYLPVINLHGVGSAKQSWQHGFHSVTNGQTELGGLPSLSESSALASWDGVEPNVLYRGLGVSGGSVTAPTSTRFGGQACSSFAAVGSPVRASTLRPWMMPATAAAGPAAPVGSMLPVPPQQQQQSLSILPGLDAGWFTSFPAVSGLTP